MSSIAQSQNPDAVARFWRKYLTILEKQKIHPNARPWYRKHVENFLESSQERLAQRSARDIDRHLDEIGGEASIEDWRFRQIADALRILFCDLVESPWAKDYDWNRWLNWSSRLPPTHPTTARDTDKSLNTPQDAEPGSSALASRLAPGDPLRTGLITAVRTRGYSIKTEQTYLHWTARFLHFHGDISPDALSGKEIVSFLEYLAVRRKVSPSTQNIALNTLVFLFTHVLKRPPGDLGEFIRARGQRRMPVVLSREEIRQLLGRMSGQSQLMTALLYGTGMRLMECVRLRVLDIDFPYHQITVRQGQGGPITRSGRAAASGTSGKRARDLRTGP